jgi:LacI family transcriptional regulator
MKVERVALLVSRQEGYGRDVSRGVIRHTYPANRWLFIYPFLPFLFARFKVRGVIGMLRDLDELSFLRQQNIPIVDTIDALPEAADIPRIAPDDHAIGAMAAAGHHVHRMDFPDTEDYDRDVIAWLRGLPKPFAAFGADDGMVRHLSDMCVQADVNVPQEAALLGVNNDELLCELSLVPISSIALPLEQIGYEAARLLKSLMRGKSPPSRPLLLAPMGVVTRASSDLHALHDVDIIAAMRFIQENADRPIDVADVADAAMLSRRTLQTRFSRTLGRTVLHEIEHARLERAKQMLTQTDLRAPEIARSAGFATALQMYRAFQRRLGTTPGEYRKQYRFR